MSGEELNIESGHETIEGYTAIDPILEKIGINQFEMNITSELVDKYLTTLEEHEAENSELQWFNNFHKKLQENTLMKTMWKEYDDKPSEQVYKADELLREFLSKLYKTSDYIQSLNPLSLEEFLTIEKDIRDTDTKYRKILTFLYLNALKEGYPRSKPNEKESYKFSYTTSLIQ